MQVLERVAVVFDPSPKADHTARFRMTMPDAPPSISPPSAPVREPASYVFLAINTALWAAADLATKFWAHGELSGYDPASSGPKKVVVWEGHLQFIFAQNPGGAWSFLKGLPDVLRRPFFLFISAAAIVFIVSVYGRIHRDQTALKWGLPLALGGAIGNLVDRVRYGWVIDFIDGFVSRGGREYHWPTFNVADIAIVIGVGLMAIDMVAGARHASREEALAHKAQEPTEEVG